MYSSVLPAQRRSLAVICAASLLATSCYSFIGRYQADTTAATPLRDAKGRRYWYVQIAKQDVPRREEYAAELFRCAPIKAAITPREALNPRQRIGQPRPVTTADASAGALVFRVGFISDVHIRQPSVKLFSDRLSRELRYVIDSFERNGYQEAFQPAVYAATISAFNNLDSVNDKPRLIVNTGDATDAGTIEEAYDFASLSHHLRYPMLYALGNHDDAIFGNYKPRLGYTKDAGPVFYPIGQRERFMRYFNGLVAIGGFSDALVPLPADFNKLELDARWAALDVPRENDPGAEDEHPSKTVKTCVMENGAFPHAAGACKMKTYCSGFDLNGKDPPDRRNCQRYPGYYAAVVPGGDGQNVQLIALDTTRGPDQWGAEAAFDDTQREWLKAQLAVQPAPDVTIVFMHHQPVSVPGLMAALDATAAKRPVLALSGHTHSHATRWRGHFWELNTGSLEEFPQWARLVEIRRANGRTYVNARVLRPEVIDADVATRLEAWEGQPTAQRERLLPWFQEQFAACDRIAAAEAGRPLCSRDPASPAGSGTLLAASARCGYLGAVYDHVMVLADGSQRAALARQEADVVLDASPY